MLKLLAGLFALENMLISRAIEKDDERGGVVIEYGVIVAVIALGLVAVGQALVTAISAWFTRMAGVIGGLGPA